VIFIIALVAAGVGILAHVAPFRFVLDSGTIWRMPAGGVKTMYLTFDDGPNPTATPELLDLLREKRVTATFFLIDDHINETTAAIVRRMVEEGHGVALHSNERWLLLRSPDAIASRLEAAAARIEAAAGRPPCPLFRPHAGWRSLSMKRALEQSGYKLAGWSWMTWDWVWFRRRTAKRVAGQVLSHAAPGKIVVIHDGHHREPRADRRYAIEAAAEIIDVLRAKGYAFGMLCDTPGRQ
jgi:peptidoglycan/xylan/chitin deacetylase (PgdA/CDA1 family)